MTRDPTTYRVFALQSAVETFALRVQVSTPSTPASPVYSVVAEPLNALQPSQPLPGQPFLTSSLQLASSGARVLGLSGKQPLSKCGGALYPPYTRDPDSSDSDQYARGAADFLAWDPTQSLNASFAVPWMLHRASIVDGIGRGSLGITDDEWSACFDCAATLGACLDLTQRLRARIQAAPPSLTAACLAPATAQVFAQSPGGSVTAQAATLAALQDDLKGSLAARSSIDASSACAYVPSPLPQSPTADSLQYTTICSPVQDSLDVTFALTVPADGLGLVPGLFTLDMSDPDSFSASKASSSFIILSPCTSPTVSCPVMDASVCRIES